MANRASAPDHPATSIEHVAGWSLTMNGPSRRPAASGDDRSPVHSPGGDQRQQPDTPVRGADADVVPQRPTGADPSPTTTAHENRYSHQRHTSSAPLSSAWATPPGRDAAALSAARYAVIAYPGPVGELISNELRLSLIHI